MADLVFPPKHRHTWIHETRVHADDRREEIVRCSRCSAVRDPARSRRGLTARRRGHDWERELARKLGMRRVGHLGGPEDLVSDWLVAQAKVGRRFPGWIWDALPPAPAGQTRCVVVADAPGPGRRRRALVCVPLDDWAALHGGE